MMLSFGLAKKLKDTGFPQNCWDFKNNLFNLAYEDETEELHLLHHDNDEGGKTGNSYLLRERDDVSLTKCPTLSELIEACGDRFNLLERTVVGWHCRPCLGKCLHFFTPEESVANLWLALQDKLAHTPSHKEHVQEPVDSARKG